MARKFLAVLGNGANKNCYYQYNEEEEYTCFVQEALIKMMCKDWTEEDKFVIFLTEDAKNKNWLSEGGLKEKIVRANPKIQIIEKYIEEGNNEEEIGKVYETMVEAIDYNDEIIFDITNAFRYLPMMALSVLNLTKEMKKTTVKGIFYGKFQGEDKLAPILDMTDLYTTMILTNHMSKIKNDNSDEVEEEDIIDDGSEYSLKCAIYKRIVMNNVLYT